MFLWDSHKIIKIYSIYQKKSMSLFGHEFEFLTWFDNLRDSSVVRSSSSYNTASLRVVMSDLEKQRKRRKKVENNVCKYTWRLHGCFHPLLGSIFMQKRRKQEDMSSCCHCTTAMWREGLHVHKLGGVMGNNCFCVRLLSYMHIDTGGSITGSVTTVASNLDHNVQIIRGWLAVEIWLCLKSLYTELIVYIRGHGLQKEEYNFQKSIFLSHLQGLNFIYYFQGVTM